MPQTTAGYALLVMAGLFLLYLAGEIGRWSWRCYAIDRSRRRALKAMRRMTATRVQTIRRMDEAEGGWRS